MRERWDRILRNIDAACSKVGRDPRFIRVIAATKKHPILRLEEAYNIGIRDFGENYLQELAIKQKALESYSDIRWHLIGPLQTKKISLLLNSSSFIHSFQALDRLSLARKLDQRINELKQIGQWNGMEKFSVFAEVNIDEVPSKTGFHVSEMPEVLASLFELKHLHVQGLMAIPEPSHSEASFSRMNDLRAYLVQYGGKHLELSMGMSQDYEMAIRYGADCVRIGTALLGDRPH